MAQGVRKLVAVAGIISDDTAIVGGEEPAEEELGRTLVVCPGGSTAAVTPSTSAHVPSMRRPWPSGRRSERLNQQTIKEVDDVAGSS